MEVRWKAEREADAAGSTSDRGGPGRIGAACPRPAAGVLVSQTGPTWGPSGQAARGMASHAKCDRISLAEPAYMGGVPYKGRGVGAACMELWGVGRGGPALGKKTQTGPKRSPDRKGCWRQGCTTKACPARPGRAPIPGCLPPPKSRSRGCLLVLLQGGPTGRGGVEP